LTKIDNAEKKRISQHESKIQRLNESNLSVMEKSMYATTKKWDTENASPTTSLESIERRLAQSHRNRERIQLEKLMQLTKHGYDVEDKLSKVRNRELAEHQELVQKTVNKMMGRHKSTSPGEKKKKGDESERNRSEYLARIEWKKQEKEREEKEALKEYKEREKQRLARINKRKEELQEYIKERKEIIKQKIENVRENLTICKEAEVENAYLLLIC